MASRHAGAMRAASPIVKRCHGAHRTRPAIFRPRALAAWAGRRELSVLPRLAAPRGLAALWVALLLLRVVRAGKIEVLNPLQSPRRLQVAD